MTSVSLLHALKEYLTEKLADLSFPQVVQKGDVELTEKAPEIYLQALPNIMPWEKYVPYVLIQAGTRTDKQDEGQRMESYCDIRMILCVTDVQPDVGAIMALNLMETIRIAILKDIVIGGKYKLDVGHGIEYEPYMPNAKPYYGGELVMTFEMPPIPRKEAFTHGFEE